MAPPTFRHRFVTAGTAAPHSVPAGELWLDVGNAAAEGVYDHHQGGASSTAALVMDRATEIIARTAGSRELTLVSHTAPDLDAVTAAWLVSGLAGARRSPPEAALHRIVTAVAEHDQGHEDDGPLDQNLGMVFNLLLLDAADDTDRMARGMALLDNIGRRMAGGCGLAQAVAAEGLGPRIAAEAAAYAIDRAEAECFPVLLPTRTGGARACDVLAFVDPRCALLKHFARRSHDGALLVSWELGGSPPEWRHIVSVDPDSGLTLERLGDALERAERAVEAASTVPLRPGRHPVAPGRGRFGGDLPSPWYDGRGHRHSIVDSPSIADPARPRCASLLSPASIRETMRRIYPRTPETTAR
ncbi:hypothetical protein FZ983_28065 [Azospirillum sp. B21]|uniref:hypothetical protein n=1 Tax=Azospirillum sp. B21 TaxID=2607496 RepID=UPI0011EC3CB4|nr:hypothetical protein [Azospirillum sp. B21]KAA0574392.1 hypothetical protein FZ983_28065 [Azospirillum sp. B21]